VTDVQTDPPTPTNPPPDPPSNSSSNSGPNSTPGHGRGRKRGSSSSFWKELPILLGAAVVVALLVRTFVLQTFYVPSESMEHTLNINDRVLVNKLVYDFRDPSRGEVIVFTSPLDWRTAENEKDFVKRVIGVPGDHVACCDSEGRLEINDVSIDEPYLDQDFGSGTAASPTKFDITVPAGRLWVMGDNRVESADSRFHYAQQDNITEATIPVSSVIGRAFVLFWPPSRATWLSVPKAFASVPNPPGG
jgi:signal peptidase I